GTRAPIRRDAKTTRPGRQPCTDRPRRPQRRPQHRNRLVPGARPALRAGPVLDSATVPSVDFWLDWRPSASVDRLRRVLPPVAEAAGLRVVERELLTTGPGWAMLDLLDPATGPGPVGTMRAQDLPEGGSQL